VTLTHIRCVCGIVELKLTGAPLMQYVCHCDDCQAVHGKPYLVALYATSDAVVTRGQPVALTLKSTPRSKCDHCGTYLFAEVPGYPFRGVNGELLADHGFNPEFHVQCRYAVAQIEDSLPHYKDTPTSFRGTGELMPW
jgi:hypothetical protein